MVLVGTSTISSPDFLRTVYLSPSGVPDSGAGAVNIATLMTLVPSGRVSDSVDWVEGGGVDGEGGWPEVLVVAVCVGGGCTGGFFPATTGLGGGGAGLGTGLASGVDSEAAE
jgi:hypothetical protein